MLSGHEFKLVENHLKSDPTALAPTSETLVALLNRHLAERFARVSNLSALVIPIEFAGPDTADEPTPCPVHPACTDHADSDYCRESWQLHLAELSRRTKAHWHRCDHDKLCAMVPVIRRNRCLAAVKLVASGSIVEEEFLRQVELLEVLVKDFVVGHADFLDRLVDVDQAAALLGAAPVPTASGLGSPRPHHPQVVRALSCIEERLSDPKLTVSAIAEELKIHPFYLGQLFANQVGERMNQYIVARRIELAKNLLATTDGLIKRVAKEVGFANPNWFCHVFSTFAGVTPRDFRSAARRR